MPDPRVGCDYTEYWVRAKKSYDMSADPAKKRKLTKLASSCPNVPLTYTVAS
ncbi:hypothetical protein [Streptomyces cuspidosporus]